MIDRCESRLAELSPFTTNPVRNLPIMRIVVTGASGQLGCHLLRELTGSTQHRVRAWSGAARGDRSGLELRPVDLTDPAAVETALGEADPEIIIHAAAMSLAEAVRLNPEQAWKVNVDGTTRLADWCRERGRRLVFTSTDMVFDGNRGWYGESDPPNPILAYGRTKAAAEAVVQSVSRGLVVRISLLYGPTSTGRGSFFDRAIANLKAGQPQAFFEDEFRTPLDYTTAARAILQLAEGEAVGIVHAAGRDGVSRYQLMRRAAESLGIDSRLVRANRREDVPLIEPRPADLSLRTDLLASLLPDLERPTIEQVMKPQ